MSSSQVTSENPLSGIANYIDKVNKALCRGVAYTTIVMVLLTFAIVALRKGADMGWIALQESVMYFHALVFMVGSAFALQCDAHVRVDVFYRQFAPTKKAWVNIIGCLLLLGPTCAVILFYSLPYVTESWRLLESSKEAGGLPLVYLLKSLIPLAAVLLLLQGISEVIKNIQLIQQSRSR